MENYIYKDLRSEILKNGGTSLAGTETVHNIRKFNKTRNLHLATDMLVSEFLQSVIVRYVNGDDIFTVKWKIQDFNLEQI